MVSIVSQVVVILVNRELSDGLVNWPEEVLIPILSSNDVHIRLNMSIFS